MDKMDGRSQERLRFLMQVTTRMELPSSEVDVVKSRAGLVVRWLQFGHGELDMSITCPCLLNWQLYIWVWSTGERSGGVMWFGSH